MDELYTFTSKKTKKCYIWASIAVTNRGRYFYFYHLSKTRKASNLLDFELTLPNIDRVYSDGNFAYNSVYGMQTTMKKSKTTNIIENLNSQLRDKISYLVRRSKAHSKSMLWLDYRLAMFFVNKNLQH
jgi:IS1 family transposase